MKIIFILLVVAAVVLVWLLFRRRAETDARPSHSGRDIADEAATAMVNIADEVIRSGDPAEGPQSRRIPPVHGR